MYFTDGCTVLKYSQRVFCHQMAYFHGEKKELELSLYFPAKSLREPMAFKLAPSRLFRIPVDQIPASGLCASLKDEWVILSYQFIFQRPRIDNLPLSVDLRERRARVFRSKQTSFQFRRQSSGNLGSGRRGFMQASLGSSLSIRGYGAIGGPFSPSN